MGVSTAWQVLGLTAATMALSAHGWLVMLDAVAAADQARRERLILVEVHHRQIIADALADRGFAVLPPATSQERPIVTFIGVAKPATEEQITAGAFWRGL
jgi:hypothetical protein